GRPGSLGHLRCRRAPRPFVWPAGRLQDPSRHPPGTAASSRRLRESLQTPPAPGVPAVTPGPPSLTGQTLRQTLVEFMDDCVSPSEAEFQAHVVSAGPADWPPVTDRVTAEARRRGLWNALLPVGPGRDDRGERELAPLMEITGRSPFLATDALNLATPDS